jgi:hypothetical protein
MTHRYEREIRDASRTVQGSYYCRVQHGSDTSPDNWPKELFFGGSTSTGSDARIRGGFTPELAARVKEHGIPLADVRRARSLMAKENPLCRLRFPVGKRGPRADVKEVLITRVKNRLEAGVAQAAAPVEERMRDLKFWNARMEKLLKGKFSGYPPR